MTSVRYRATHVITQDAEERWLSPGVVDLAGGRISWVGAPDEAPPLPEGVPTHDLEGLLVPGFVNAHAHSPMVLLRGAGEGLPVDRWLVEVMWPREARITGEDVRWAMTFGAAQLLAGGYTTSLEMYFHPDEMAAAAGDAGMRCLVAPPLLVAEGMEVLGTWEEQLERAVSFSRGLRGDDLVTAVVGPHSAYTVPAEALREAARVAADEGLLLHTHVAEGEHEGDGILAEHGVSVPFYLDRLGLLDGTVLFAHGVWLDKDDVALVGERGVGVAHCPVSNGKHASGIAPVGDLRAAGVPVAIATDGPASSARLDPFEEMRTAIMLARLRAGDASVLGPRDALAMVTREAAVAIGRDDLGAIEAGRRADLLLVDLDPVLLAPVVERDDLLTHLVWSGSPALVRRVWVDGREVVRDGALTTLDVEAVAAEVTARARRLAAA